MKKLVKKLISLSLLIIIIFSCSSAVEKVQEINSRRNLDNIIATSVSDQKSEPDFDKYVFIDSIKNLLLQKKTIDLDSKYKDLIKEINFDKLSDTIYLGDIHAKTLSGGIPLIFEYDVKPNDVVYFDIDNLSSNKVNKIEILEADKVRYLYENQRRKDKISSSFSVISGPKITLKITNESPVKNLGLFKSKLKISIKKISNIALVSKTIADTIIFTKKINKTVYDTIYNMESNLNFKLSSKLNFSEKSFIEIPIRVSDNENLRAWSYWLGLNSQDSLEIKDVRNNPISYYIENELNKKLINKNISNDLISQNKNIDITFENFTNDRRGLNFARNYSMFSVDNNFSSDLKTKAKLKLSNTSNLYDYDLKFILISANLIPKTVEEDVVAIDVKEKIRLNLIGL
tara:strand:- start:1325 stop:2527 length:1203 start_codon:yes stop_codon:yes gene_type:complete